MFKEQQHLERLVLCLGFKGVSLRCSGLLAASGLAWRYPVEPPPE